MLPIFFKRLNAIPIYHFMIGILFFALFFPNSNLSSFLYSQLGYIEFGTNLASSAFVHTKCSFACWELSPKPSESIRNLIELPVCFHPFITYIIFASNQAFLPFHKPIPKTDKYLNENNPNSLVLRL
jgi:hypothetical protein